MANQDASSLSRDEINFADQVRKLREELGLSQEDLARRMRVADLEYVNQTTVSRIENKTRPVRLAEAQALSMVFNRTLYAMTHPDSREVWLSLIENNDRRGRRSYVQFKNALHETAVAQVQAENDVSHLLYLFASDADELSPDTKAKYESVLLNRQNFAGIHLLTEAMQIVNGAREMSSPRSLGFEDVDPTRLAEENWGVNHDIPEDRLRRFTENVFSDD